MLALALALPAGVTAAPYAPTGDELSLLAMANEARSSIGLRPLVWHDGLGQAARAHSTDMADHGCFQHNSCNGQSWSTRIGQYYPSWSSLGEIIALGGDPRSLHEDWMGSPVHRAKILGSFSEFGAGIALELTNFGEWAYATEDFGERGAIDLSSIPTLPSAGVAPRVGLDPSREVLVNYHHHNGGAPQAVRALIGSSCVHLDRVAGSAANGTYGGEYTFAGSGCIPVVFEAIRSDGVRQRFPATKALLVGVGAAGLLCAETTTAVPSQDCGGSSPGPTPTPTPGPTPDGTVDLTDLRVALRPGRVDAAAGTVSLTATLPSLPDFDPTTGPLSIDIAVQGESVWQLVVPAQCEEGPCLTPNDRRTTFRARLETASLSFARMAGDRWKLRLSARKQTMSALDAGLVEVTLSADGTTIAGAAEGELKASGLIAK